MSSYSVIVIGGGHAGTEAALASARMKARTLLVTHSIKTIGQMSCNPAIGGIGKSHLAREVDALGGLMAVAADHAGIQFRTLNTTKGAAVRATRAQIDRTLYRNFVQKVVCNTPYLDLYEGAVARLLFTGEQVTGVVTEGGDRFDASSVVLTTGTFLAGKIHIGDSQQSGGRANDPASVSLAECLRALPLHVGRLKTGTPPRLAGDTIDFKQLDEQKSETPLPVMSFIGSFKQHPEQRSCFLTQTNEKTHEIIRANLHKSPMVRKLIKGTGPRYCPSIEDKVVKFSERQTHQVFIEPEGLNASEWYPNGISTSLPEKTQEEFVRSIKGFERVRIVRPGYAIEYDYFDPRDLAPSLETNAIKHLFFAGQINGTTGYEEAAAQGVLAGINAVLKSRDQAPLIVGRSEAYIGVLVDDLSVNGVTEPYRIFTSRAEYRLLLREDNADMRLTPKARALGLINDHRWDVFNRKYEHIESEKKRLRTTRMTPRHPTRHALVSSFNISPRKSESLFDLLKRPQFSYKDLQSIDKACLDDAQLAKQVEAEIKYDGYIKRQRLEVDRLSQNENTVLPAELDYQHVRGLSNEARQKLNTVRPDTLGQARRVSGITPATLSVLLVYLKQHHGLVATP